MSRITIDHINAMIQDEQYHLFPMTMMTVCCLTLENGFNVIGTAACADPNIFNEALGIEYAKKDAVSKVWQLEGYRLKQALYDGDGNVLSGFPE